MVHNFVFCALFTVQNYYKLFKYARFRRKKIKNACIICIFTSFFCDPSHFFDVNRQFRPALPLGYHAIG